MRIIVTGGDGFIGRNLRVRLAEAGYRDVQNVTSQTSDSVLRDSLANADFVYHLAGANRPPEVGDFQRVNADFTEHLCGLLEAQGRPIGVAFSSSTQAGLDNPYGISKRRGEEVVQAYGSRTGSPYYLFRFPNVFGKWSRPDYNSAIATFCHNLARGLPITVNDPSTRLDLLYIDDAVTALMSLLEGEHPSGMVTADPVYSTTLGEVVSQLESFTASRQSLTIPRVGIGLTRALYATYLSFLPPESFAYGLRSHVDPRGAFVEVLKTRDSGQFSFFTAAPGVTRGGHYHHTKNEKFLIVQGTARFGFRNLATDEQYEIISSGDRPAIVETVPGWVHNVTNIGSSEMIALLWANEIFDPAAPDTCPAAVDLEEA